MSKSNVAVLLSAADQCRAIQRLFWQNRRKARNRATKEFWENCAAGAGACAADIEAKAGLNLSQIGERAKSVSRADSTPRP